MKQLALILFILSGLAANASTQKIDETLTPTLEPTPKPEVNLNDINLDNRLDRRRIGRFRLLAKEGGWSGNGGDFNQVAHNIWFISSDDETIKYCLKSSEDYSLSKAQLKELIQKSINDWLKFFKKYELANNSLAGDYKIDVRNKLHFSDGKNRKMVQKFEFSESCEKTKLQFFFGIENQVIKEYKKFATDHPYGLAIRKSFDHVNFQNEGIIWVDNFSKDSHEISHILLHELGHMFGMQHNSTYVMDEQIAELLTAQGKFKSSFLGKIESDSWKYGLLKNKAVVLSSNRGRAERKHRRRQFFAAKKCDDPTYTPNNLLPRKVRRIFGFSSDKCHRLSLTFKESDAYRTGRLRGRKSRHFELTLRESGQDKKIQMIGRLGPTKGMRPKFQGPGVFTELSFEGPRKTKKVFRKLTLEKSPSIFPLSGSFSYNGVVYPAKINSERGLIIDIFVPQMNRWWTLKTSNNQFE